ncbi:patatin-like phospholipase family protein [Mycolicibacterium sphagni]|nr:patatin-like phospholipase family protein [Mycolicibacterium sphagni]
MQLAPSPRIAVTLSGGGYRASAFAAGVLLYLIDCGRASQIRAISSVSGGSITNAYFARNVLTSDLTPETSWNRCAPLLAFLSKRDILSPRRMVLITAFLSIPTGAAAGAIANISGRASPQVALYFGVALALLLFSAGLTILFLELRRSLEVAVQWLLDLGGTATKVTANKFSARKFVSAILTLRLNRAMAIFRPKMTLFQDINATYEPIFCCTDLATGTHFFIGSSFVSGVSGSPNKKSEVVNFTGTADELPIATAVAASAAFPLVFRPTVIDASTLGLPVQRGIVSGQIMLADGGLFDNLGFTPIDSWMIGDMDAAVLRELGPGPDVCIVVDSGRPSHQPQTRHNLTRFLTRSIDVVHQSNSLVRRKELQRKFAVAPAWGTLVGIGDDPYEIVDSLDNSPLAQALEGWLEKVNKIHGLNPAAWKALAQERNPSVKTNLRRLGTKDLSRLVLHGYTAAMIRTCVELGWDARDAPLPSVDIDALCAGEFVGSLIDRTAWAFVGPGANHIGRNRDHG